MKRKLWTDLNDTFRIDAENYLATKVHEDYPEWSGLYDAKGNKLFKEKDPIGFIRRSKDG